MSEIDTTDPTTLEIRVLKTEVFSLKEEVSEERKLRQAAEAVADALRARLEALGG